MLFRVITILRGLLATYQLPLSAAEIWAPFGKYVTGQLTSSDSRTPSMELPYTSTTKILHTDAPKSVQSLSAVSLQALVQHGVAEAMDVIATDSKDKDGSGDEQRDSSEPRDSSELVAEVVEAEGKSVSVRRDSRKISFGRQALGGMTDEVQRGLALAQRKGSITMSKRSISSLSPRSTFVDTEIFPDLLATDSFQPDLSRTNTMQSEDKVFSQPGSFQTSGGPLDSWVEHQRRLQRNLVASSATDLQVRPDQATTAPTRNDITFAADRAPMHANHQGNSSEGDNDDKVRTTAAWP